jgi:RNA polymerase sigma factor (sigma-70 family)
MQKPIEDLLRACKMGNQMAQLQLYDKYCNAMFTVACRYLKNEEDAKDAMQEGFLKAFMKLEYYKPESTFGSWLKQIVIHQCLDVLKKRQIKFAEAEISELQITDEDDWTFDIEVTKTDALNALEQLVEKYKVVLTLYLIEGYDHSEISEILDIPIKTSRTHLRRGKIKLKELLKSKYNETRY